MEPIEFQQANRILRGGGEVGDLKAQVIGRNSEGDECHPSAPQCVEIIVRSMWKPTEDELNRLKAGAAVQLDVYTMTGTIPPIALTASGIFPETMIN